MRSAIYVLGFTATFALLGLWYSTLSDSSPLWTTFLGGAVGYALGASFKRFLPTR